MSWPELGTHELNRIKPEQLQKLGLVIGRIDQSEYYLLGQAHSGGDEINFPEDKPEASPEIDYLPESSAAEYYRQVYPEMLKHWISKGGDPRWMFVGSPAGCTILDYGCGEAQMARRLAEYNDVYGVDISLDLLNEASKSGLIVSEVDLDRQKLPYTEEKFDLVYAFDVLEHLYQLDDAIDEVYRTLKYGGILMVTVPLLQERTMQANVEFHQNSVANLGIENHLADREPEVNIKRFKEWVDLFTAHNFLFLSRAIGYTWNDGVSAAEQRAIMRGTPGEAENAFFLLQKMWYPPGYSFIGNQERQNRWTAAGSLSHMELDYAEQDPFEGRILPSLALRDFLLEGEV